MKIEGLDKLLKDIDGLSDKLVPVIEKESISLAQRIRDTARSLVSKVTGNLSRNIKVGKPSKNRKRKYFISSKVWFSKAGMYGVPLEFGHRLVFFGTQTNKQVAPKPFLRPAADQHTKETEQKIIDAIWKKVREEVGD